MEVYLCTLNELLLKDTNAAQLRKKAMLPGVISLLKLNGYLFRRNSRAA